MNRSGSLRSSSSGGSTSTGDSLCNEMSALMHDYETVSRMADLAASLRAPYPELAPETFRALLQAIQRSIQVHMRAFSHLLFTCLWLYNTSIDSVRSELIALIKFHIDGCFYN